MQLSGEFSNGGEMNERQGGASRLKIARAAYFLGSASLAQTGRWSEATPASMLWWTPAPSQCHSPEIATRSSCATGRREGKLRPGASTRHGLCSSRKDPPCCDHSLKSPIKTVGQ